MNAASHPLKSRLDGLTFRSYGLQGRIQELELRNTELVNAVALAKARTAVVPEVDSLLEALQIRAHERSLGIFEKLLTAIVKDVIPTAGDVKLELGTERGLPALHFNFINDGVLEDIYESSGGAVTNVVILGLRIAALSRSKNRRLLVLDEPDCWVKPDRITKFVKVVSDVAEQAKVQTFFVSHHDLSFFEDYVSIIELAADDTGKVYVSKNQPKLQWENDEDPGIRYIHLQTFKSHHDTKLFFGPGVTGLIGDNDLGKSNAVNASLKAVAYNESDDRFIHRDFDEAIIEIGLEKGYVIRWARKRKGSPKVTYTLLKDGEVIAEGRPEKRGEVPAWVQEHLKICRVEDLDVQLGYQKNPVFLLDEAPSKRASILSVGKESSHLTSLIESFGQQKRRDREIIKSGEIELARNTMRLYAKPAVVKASSSIESLSQRLPVFVEQARTFESLRKVVSNLSQLERQCAQLQASKRALMSLPDQTLELTDTAALQTSISRIEQGQKSIKAKAELRTEMPAELEFIEVQRIKELGSRIATLSTLLEKLSKFKLNLPEEPVFQDPAALMQMGTKLAALEKTANQLAEDNKKLEFEMKIAQEDLEMYIEVIGGVCPLCENEIGHVHEKGHSHA